MKLNKILFFSILLLVLSSFNVLAVWDGHGWTDDSGSPSLASGLIINVSGGTNLYLQQVEFFSGVTAGNVAIYENGTDHYINTTVSGGFATFNNITLRSGYNYSVVAYNGGLGIVYTRRFDNNEASYPDTQTNIQFLGDAVWNAPGWSFRYDIAENIKRIRTIEISPPSTNFTITAETFYLSNSINNFNATINGVDYGTTTGTITTSLQSTNESLQNISVYSTDYFSYNTLTYNVSALGNLNTILKQSEINFSCFEYISGNPLNCINNTIFPDAQNYNWTIYVNNYYNITQEFTINALDNKTFNVTGFYNSNFTFFNNFINGVGGPATNCSYTLTNTENPTWNYILNGTHGVSTGLILGNYTALADCDGYAYTNNTFNVLNWTQNTTFNLYTTNSIDITIYDETTGNLINGTNITVTKTIGASQTQNKTDTGTISYAELTPGNYTFNFVGGDYSSRNYDVVIGNRTYQTLNVYLLANSTDAVIFTFQEYQSNQVIEDVTLTVNKIINGSDTLIAVLMSDITGRTQFYFDVASKYCFSASKPTYTTKTWCFDPIIFSTYTISLQTSVSLSTGDDYEEILIDFTPNKYYNNQNNTITFTFAQPGGELTNYGFNATYKTTTISASGTNAYGSVITNDLNILNAQYGDEVILEYYYIKSDGIPRSFKKIYGILGYNSTQDSILDNPPSDYNLGLFETTLISVLITLLVAGAGAYFGGALAGGIMALTIMSYLMYISFLNFWAGSISIIILFTLLSWRSTQ